MWLLVQIIGPCEHSVDQKFNLNFMKINQNVFHDDFYLAFETGSHRIRN